MNRRDFFAGGFCGILGALGARFLKPEPEPSQLPVQTTGYAQIVGGINPSTATITTTNTFRNSDIVIYNNAWLANASWSWTANS